MAIVVPPGKVKDYLLNRSHPEGRAKARFFLSRGFSIDNTARMEAALATHASSAVLVKRARHPDGVKLTYECKIETPDGSGPCVRSVWIEDKVTGDTRLVTSYPFEK